MCLAIPGRVQEIYQAHGTRMGKLDFGGIIKEVCLEYLPEISVGEYAMVHVGFAINKIDEEAARETLEVLRQIGSLTEEIPPDYSDDRGPVGAVEAP